jgi:hypothetical protein
LVLAEPTDIEDLMTPTKTMTAFERAEIIIDSAKALA